MKNLKFMLLVLLCASAAHAQPQRIPGLGADRAVLTSEQIAARTIRLQRGSDFYLLRHEDARNAPGRIFDPAIWTIIQKSARDNNLDPMTIAAVIFIESYGRPEVKSGTGPAGIGQISRASAKDLGLVVKVIRRKIGSHKEPVYRYRGRGKNRKRIVVRYKTVTDYQVTRIDERLEPAKAIPAMARRLASRVSIFGREDFAIQEYHDGLGRVLKLISAYTGIPRPIRIISRVLGRQEVTEKTVAGILAANQLSYPEIFFRNTPYYKTAAFKFLGNIPDFGATYYFNVEEARRLLGVYRESPAEFARLVQGYENKFGNRTLPNLMWSFYTPEQVQQLRFADLEAINLAKRHGRLVNLPTPWAKYGFYVRVTGPSRIAEKDPLHQADYIAAEPATIGCLLYVINELKLLEQARYQPLELNSAVRNDQTQGKLHGSNSNSRTALPTHTMGKAFDLPLKNLKKWQKDDLLFILYDLEISGMLAYVKEGSQDTIHVVANPEFEQFFTNYYKETIKATW